MIRRTVFLLAGAVCIATACHAAIRSTPTSAPTPDQTAELWHAPGPNRDLFWGVGGDRLAPDPSATYNVLEVKRGGFSMGLTVEGPGGLTWRAKMPPEATTEVVAPRLLWGVGYHQPLHVRFDYRGRHGVLVDHMTAADVRWICEKLQRLTDRQWQAAFRAGGYAPEVANPFIRRFTQKIEEGLAL